ncbi:XPG/RAD2 endonuclease [Penicillium verhagenii]|uniref:XPG/RAD2 endonuclease n=1 Tax=Penicillium verhagenii TaxID=1562060 RepID=UPI002544D61B|nr:XPG/RAD2 endonuclease [Penicillium verhagenii]KAJ5924210.1 XPG/RAD2 endonuclease [Penicillium verhagenii]
MGVTGLWTVVQPCARPIKLETLNKKRLAVDASIWIYQFLKAVRDKEGNALRNSHIVGFFRRICKLLYVGIRPVFVFDGGAPILKRETINKRKRRREGRREDASRTAGKLLAVQMLRIAEEEAEARKQSKKRVRGDEEEEIGAPVYAEEAMLTEKERQNNRSFKKKDAYHLPNLDISLEDMGAPNDPRIMSQEELEEYARHFHQGQDINLYDFSKIDFDSAFFLSLPPTDRYNILNAARLRSRLRMGYSKDQLDVMFPNRMDFSKFQIERVTERNDLTQRLMNINGMNGEEAFYKSGQRIAGERGREYVLVKDSQHEGGWVLGVVGNKNEGHEDKPIDVDQIGLPDLPSGSDESDEEFEDVPIEGLNRLPKLPFLQQGVFDSSLQQSREESDMRRATHESRREEVDDNSLFVPSEGPLLPQNRNDKTDSYFDDEEDEELQKAISLSMQPNDDHDDDMPDIQINRPMTTMTHTEAMPDPNLSESDDDGMDFAAAVAQTKVSTNKPRPQNPFDGPLPFESIKLTKVVKDDKPLQIDDNEGGFMKESSKKAKGGPLPPWFAGAKLNEEFIVDPTFEDPEDYKEPEDPDHLFLSNRRPAEVIDVDEMSDTKEVVELDEDPEDEPVTDSNFIELKPSSETAEILNPEVADVGSNVESRLEEEREVGPDHNPTTESSLEPVFETVNSPFPSSVDVQKESQHEPLPPREEILDKGQHSQATRPEDSPEPEFEDVLAPLPAPEITVVSRATVPNQRVELPEELINNEPTMEYEGEFSDPEDEELMQQLAEESEEHARFAQTLNSAAPIQTALDYEEELKQLRNQQQKDRRDADEVTTIMINECQQLLKLFGLPYITAPMEAEAQCAELVSLGLVDGIVTDDSDTFLFGGTRVYKNMFNQSKYVECYLTSDFEKEYSLHRKKLISFAHLLGSDYTEGIPGIGPVTALELITEFSSLEEFRDWWSELQMGVNNPDDKHVAFRKKFRKKASKIFLPPSFPDERVEAAYLEPEVDSDPSQFQWGVPDLNGLRGFLMSTIGWSPERTDEVLVPVIRDMNRRGEEGTQSNITQFMQGPQGAGAFAPRVRSGGVSRMEKAFGRLQRQAQIAQDPSASEPMEDEANTTSAPTQEKGTSTQTGKGTGRTNKKRKTRATSDKL